MDSLSSDHIWKILQDPRLELTKISDSETIVWRFQEYFRQLEKWNRRINLTSEKSAEEAFNKHGFDSLQYLRWIEPDHRVLDIGSGGGFPGIPLKIILPALPLTLIESQRKRCNFLREVGRLLKLDSLTIVEGRAEDISRAIEYSQNYDRVVFRGFGSIVDCVSQAVPFLAGGGQIILMRDPEEMPASGKHLPSFTKLHTSMLVEGLDGKKSLMVVLEKCST